jgi:uracil-DNA glycosylase family 4
MFCSQWGEGRGSSLCPGARHICLARGQIPCDVLFVGEAPSVGADVIGQPFVGEVREVIDEIIKRSAVPKSVRCAYTNLVCCIPRSEDGRARVRQPSYEEFLTCQPRLLEFIEICNPKLIVAVGWLANNWVPLALAEREWRRPIPVAHIVHPAHILRKRPYVAYDLSVAAERLARALAEHVIEETSGT